MAELTIEQRVRSLICDFYGPSGKDYGLDAPIWDHIGGNGCLADSLDKIDFMARLEDEFGVAITDNEADLLGNAQSIISLVDLKLQPAPDGH